jgi:type II secretory pathway component PulM
MQTNDVLQIAIGVEVAMIDPNGENRKQYETDIPNVRPQRVRYGKRVSNIRYRTKTTNNRTWSEDLNDFISTTDRNYGFLMEVDNSGKPYYVVVKPKNIIASRAEYEGFWIPELARLEQERIVRDAQREIEQQRQQKRNEIRLAREAQLKPEAERTAEVIGEAISALLGQRARFSATIRVEHEGTWTDEDTDNPQYETRQTGTITLILKDFQRLLEKAMQE